MKKDYIYIPLIFLFVFLNVKQCNENKNLKNQRQNTSDFLNDTISYYQNKLGQIVAKKKTLSGDKNQLEILLSKQIDSTQELKTLVYKYKDVNSATIIQTETNIDTTFIPFSKPVKCDFFKEFSFNKDMLSISGVSNQEGITINSFNSKAKISLVIGKRKNGWFKGSTYSIDAKSSNPNVSIIGLDAYQFQPKVKRWGLGPSIGYNPFTNGFELSLSLQYSLIRF